MVHQYFRKIMVLGKLFKPRPVALSETVEAVKAQKKFTIFLGVASKAESSEAIKWFRGQVYHYSWETFLYPDKVNSTPEAKVYMLSVSAPTKDELLNRLAQLQETLPENLMLTVLAEPVALAETCKELLALGGQKEGGSL
jgi:hypothetical protein